MDVIDVPPYFLCPISLELMKEPVTVSTGITYDRESIEKWIFSGKNDTCPVTRTVLLNSDLTPNHTIQQLIQSWCTLNASHGIQCLPTPKPPIHKSQIEKLLIDAKSPEMQMKCLQRLRSIASTNETNKRCMEAAGVVEFLVSLVNENCRNDDHDLFEFKKSPSDEALSILYHLQLSESRLKSLVASNGDFIESLTHVMQNGSFESRAFAIFLLNSMVEVAEPMRLVSLSPQLFVELVQVLQDEMSYKASKAALQILINVVSWGRNKVKAVEAGTVSALVDLLVDNCSERRACEMILTVLDVLCQCAEGRAELLSHGAGLAIVSKKILRVSKVANERGVRILLSVSKSSATPTVVQEMVALGVVAKLCLVLQVDCGTKTKERTREILKLHAKAWKNSSCMPITLLSSIPS